MDATNITHDCTQVRLIGEYRTLLGKRDLLGVKLQLLDSMRLSDLATRLRAPIEASRGPRARLTRRLPVSVEVRWSVGQGDTRRGEACDISGDGMFVRTSTPMPPDARIVLRILDLEAMEEWQFSAEVVHAHHRGMGLRFHGIPVCIRRTPKGIGGTRIGQLRRPMQRRAA